MGGLAPSGFLLSMYFCWNPDLGMEEFGESGLFRNTSKNFIVIFITTNMGRLRSRVKTIIERVAAVLKKGCFLENFWSLVLGYK